MDFSNILIASDYDRTLTGFSREIPQANHDAIDEFIANGGAFTVATGRSKPMFAGKLKTLRVNAPVILFNGAAIWYPETDEAEVLYPLPENYLEMTKHLHSEFPQLRIEFQGLKRHNCIGYDAFRDAYVAENDVPFCYNGWDMGDDTVLSISFYLPFGTVGYLRAEELSAEEHQTLDALGALVEREYGSSVISMRSMPQLLELAPKGCGKGVTARALAERLGRTRLICAGDAPNDLSMLQEADDAFIPSSAEQSMKGLGFTEVASCDEGTIAAIIARLKAE